jgi:hypothetical protein
VVSNFLRQLPLPGGTCRPKYTGPVGRSGEFVGEFESARARPAARAILLAALAIALLVVPGLPGVGTRNSPSQSTRPDTGAFTGVLSNVSLAIEGASYPPEGTTDTNLQSHWGPVPQDCSIFPVWYSWFLPSPSAAEGIFTDPGFAETKFVPETLAAGVAEVGLHSVARLSCPSIDSTLSAVAFTNVSSNPPPSLSNLSVSPSATRAPGPVNLTGVASGGRPPYLLGVAWGDGTFSNTTVTDPGPFFETHTFGPGTYSPRIALLDSERLDVRAGVSVPVVVTNATALTVLSSLPLAEVGKPVEFHGVVERPSWHLGTSMACAASVLVPPGSNLTNLSCTPSAPGILDATLEVLGPEPYFDVIITREQPVAEPVSISVRTIDPSVDAGTLTYVEVSIAGGVPPFNVTCGAGASVLCDVSNASPDGSFLVPWTPDRAGVIPLTASVVDSLGAVATTLPERATVESAPQLSLHANVTVSAPSTTVLLNATVRGGSYPLVWWVVPTIPPTNGSPPVGRSTTGSFGWVGTFEQEGVTTVSVQVLDSALSSVIEPAEVALPLLPNLQAILPLIPVSPLPRPILLVNLSSGVPPFESWVNTSQTNLWNGTWPTSGDFVVALPAGLAGRTELGITVTDARGYRAEANVTGLFPAPVVGRVSSASWNNATLGVLGILVGALTLTYLIARMRRRDRAPDPPVLDPERVVENLLLPADGADRFTIEMMAEEQGIALELVRSTIDRLIQEGRIRTEAEPGGGEVLAWESAEDP